MIHTDKMRQMMGTATKEVILDGVPIQIETLPPNVQQAVTTLQEWQADIRWKETELMKIRRAAMSLSTDIADEIKKLMTPPEPVVDTSTAPTTKAVKKSSKKKSTKLQEHDGRGPG